MRWWKFLYNIYVIGLYMIWEISVFSCLVDDNEKSKSWMEYVTRFYIKKNIIHFIIIKVSCKIEIRQIEISKSILMEEGPLSLRLLYGLINF